MSKATELQEDWTLSEKALAVAEKAAAFALQLRPETRSQIADAAALYVDMMRDVNAITQGKAMSSEYGALNRDLEIAANEFHTLLQLAASTEGLAARLFGLDPSNAEHRKTAGKHAATILGCVKSVRDGATALCKKVQNADHQAQKKRLPRLTAKEQRKLPLRKLAFEVMNALAADGVPLTNDKSGRAGWSKFLTALSKQLPEDVRPKKTALTNQATHYPPQARTTWKEFQRILDLNSRPQSVGLSGETGPTAQGNAFSSSADDL
jgi:hypothetical protein